MLVTSSEATDTKLTPPEDPVMMLETETVVLSIYHVTQVLLRLVMKSCFKKQIQSICSIENRSVPIRLS